MSTNNPQQAYFRVMERVPTPVYYWAGIASIVGSLILMLNGKK